MDLEEGIKYLDSCGRSADEKVTDHINKRDPVTQCFSNPLIMECLLEHLDHSSTKIFSQSCQSILSLIRSSRAFITKTIFCIGSHARPVSQSMWPLSEAERSERIVDLTFLQNVNFPWTSMRISTACLDHVGIQIVINLLSRVVRLELSNCASTRGIEKLKGADLYRILDAAESLKELVIDESYFKMAEVERKMFMSNSKVQAIVQNLDVLHIRSDERYTGYDDQLTFLQLARDETVKSFLSVPKYLKSFSFQSEALSEDVVVTSRSLLTLTNKNANTLISLTLHRWAWDSDDVLDLVCPNLKQLSIIARGDDLPRVCQFIMKQGQLLKLDVNLDSGTTLSPKPLADTLTLRGSQLITLSLAWKLDPPRADPHVPGPSLDFSWLQNLNKLRNITIRQFTGRYGDSETLAPVSHLLANVPAGVKRIDFAGALQPNPEFEQVHTELMVENLGRFRDLTVLNLLRCQNALNDDILLFISSNLTQLRELGFSSCDDVTDIGFTGIGALKGLVKLKFFQCRSLLKKYEILLSFSFPELKELHIERDSNCWLSIPQDGRLQADADYFKKFMGRNRMLEKLVFEYYDSILEEDLKKHGRISVEVINPNERAYSLRTLEDGTNDDSDDYYGASNDESYDLADFEVQRPEVID